MCGCVARAQSSSARSQAAGSPEPAASSARLCSARAFGAAGVAPPSPGGDASGLAAGNDSPPGAATPCDSSAARLRSHHHVPNATAASSQSAKLANAATRQNCATPATCVVPDAAGGVTFRLVAMLALGGAGVLFAVAAAVPM